MRPRRRYIHSFDVRGNFLGARRVTVWDRTRTFFLILVGIGVILGVLKLAMDSEVVRPRTLMEHFDP